jgi:hypothetical protein
MEEALVSIEHCAPLSSIQRHLNVGQPLPVNVRDREGALLLARGHLIESKEQLGSLLDRGMLVDTRELRSLSLSAEDVRNAHQAHLPQLWKLCFDRVQYALQNAKPEELSNLIENSTQPVIALVERDPDLAIFQMMRRESINRLYGVTRSLHAAMCTHMASAVLGWSAEDSHRIFKAALTMNLSMLDLQSQLSMQVSPPSATQREAILSHPTRSREMLEAAGITDPDWLTAVSQHHEKSNGRGYPHGLTDIHEWAELIHIADSYTAMLSVRATRDAMLPNDAARKLFQEYPGNPKSAAVIKAFGIYPPGTHVRLASGEIGVAIERGPTVNTPIVLAITNSQGDPLAQPMRLETHRKPYTVIGVLAAKNVRVRVSPEKLVQVQIQNQAETQAKTQETEGMVSPR